MTRPRPFRPAATLAVSLAALAAAGCLGEPEIEDRWTRLDVRSSSIQPRQSLPGGATQPITVRMAITYRAIVTGVAVVELRASGSISTSDVAVDPEAPRLPMAQDIDRILAGSTSLGRAVRPVTGWDHLIQEIELTFPARTPAAGDSAASGLFLVCYLGSGEEVERADGTDSLVVTPFDSMAHELLPVGMELARPSP